MDPQANAKGMVGLAKQILEAEDQGIEVDPDLASILAELVIAQATWQANGGWVPSWSKALGNE